MQSASPASSTSFGQQLSPVHSAPMPANPVQTPRSAARAAASLGAQAPAPAMQTGLTGAPFLTSGSKRAKLDSDFAANAAVAPAPAPMASAVMPEAVNHPTIDINRINEDGHTALSRAAESGDDNAVSTLLKMPGIDVNARNSDGDTALICAARQGHAATVLALLAVQGIDVNAKNSDGATALSSAATRQREAIVRVLLATRGIDVNDRYTGIHSLLLHATLKGWEAIFHVLIALPGIDINTVVDEGETLLMKAVMQGREAIVRTLLAIPGIDVNARATYGDTALTWAACDGNESIVRALLAMPGIKFDLVDIQGKMRGHGDAEKMKRSLAALSAYRRPSVDECAALEGLLQRIFPVHAGPAQTQAFAGADSDARMLNDACARLRFGECDTAEVPELLRSLSHLPREERLAAAYALAFGASIGYFRDEEGNLDKAIAKALKEMHLLAEYRDSSRMLSNARDNINLYRVGKMNLLCAAAEEGNLPMIRGLVRLGAFVNVPSPNGDTALATAVATRQWAACVELISLGALPTLPDKSGYPMIYHLVSDFCKNVPESEALVGLIRYLIYRGVRFTIPVKNPDEKARAEIPMVLVSDLLCSKAEPWQRYGHRLLGLGGKAPAVALPGRAIDIPASANTTTTPGIDLVNAFPAAASASNIDRMLATDDELASFIAWLGRDARRYRWQDAQSGQGLLHRAAAIGNFEAVRLLLERGLDRRLVDRQGRTAAQLLPASHMRSARLADLLES